MNSLHCNKYNTVPTCHCDNALVHKLQSCADIRSPLLFALWPLEIRHLHHLPAHRPQQAMLQLRAACQMLAHEMRRAVHLHHHSRPARKPTQKHIDAVSPTPLRHLLFEHLHAVCCQHLPQHRCHLPLQLARRSMMRLGSELLSAMLGEVVEVALRQDDRGLQLRCLVLE